MLVRLTHTIDLHQHHVIGQIQRRGELTQQRPGAAIGMRLVYCDYALSRIMFPSSMQHSSNLIRVMGIVINHIVPVDLPLVLKPSPDSSE